MASSTDVSSRGTQNVSGGTTTGTTVNSGGTETVFSGGTASGTVVSGNDSASFVNSLGDVDAAQFVASGGGAQIVSSGGTASGTVVFSARRVQFGRAPVALARRHHGVQRGLPGGLRRHSQRHDSERWRLCRDRLRRLDGRRPA